MLQQYGEIIPGGAERLVAWVESETAHRQAMEKLLVEGGLDIEKRGQMFALLITLGTIGAGTALIVSGFGIGGLALIVGELAILAGVFIYGRVTEGRSQAGTDDSRRGSSPPRD